MLFNFAFFFSRFFVYKYNKPLFPSKNTKQKKKYKKIDKNMTKYFMKTMILFGCKKQLQIEKNVALIHFTITMINFRILNVFHIILLIYIFLKQTFRRHKRSAYKSETSWLRIYDSSMYKWGIRAPFFSHFLDF